MIEYCAMLEMLDIKELYLWKILKAIYSFTQIADIARELSHLDKRGDWQA